MLKFLLILILTIYLFYRAASFLFRVVFGGPRGQFYYQGQHRQKKAPNSNLNVDRVPRDKHKKRDGYEGGDYVDFEEVK